MSPMRICSMLWMALGVIWLLLRLRTKETQEKAEWGARVAYGIPVLVAFYLLFGDKIPFDWLRFRIGPHNFFSGSVGVGLTAVGVAFAIWARVYIGQNWSSAPSVKVGHELIRTGPYAWVRHPIYSGLLLATIGTALARAELRGVIALLLLWPAFLLKSRLEERFMLNTFGSEYDDYRRATRGLIPRLSGRSAQLHRKFR